MQRILGFFKWLLSIQHYIFIFICVFFLFLFFISTHTCQNCAIHQGWAMFIFKNVLEHQKIYQMINKGLLGFSILEGLFGLYMVYKHIRFKSFYV